MRAAFRSFAVVAALLAVACSKAPESAPAASSSTPSASEAALAGATQAEQGVAWQTGDVDAAFAQAKAEGKPLFLYWGAVWCPPCNEVKATIFSRQDFVERSRFFVPVYVDGDGPSAQKLGARFKVSGYPTMVLFTPDGREITRLPGEADADQYMQVLALGMNGARPVRETLATALAGGRLAPEDWRMLAWYSWVGDDKQLVAEGRLPETLQKLAKVCPADQRQAAARLWLQSLAAAAKAKKAKARDDKATVEALLPLLADARFARDNFDVVVYYADNIAGKITLPATPRRAQLTQAWHAALERLATDSTLASLDRLTAVDAQIGLANLDAPKGQIGPALQQRARDEVARAVREARDPYARAAIFSGAAETLADAGLLDESDALLKTEIERSTTPYYYMVGLAANARTRGDKAGAIDWAEKAYAAAKGPATRLQWGVRYVSLLTELAPQDAARIESAVGQVIGELEPSSDTFYGRNQKSLARLGGSLAAWNRNGQHRQALQKLRSDMAGVCARLATDDPARGTCERTLEGVRPG